MQPSQKQQHLKSWRAIVRSLDWACLAIIILLAVVTLAVVQKRMQPVERPIFLNDATISYSYSGTKEMHFAVALLVPFLVLIATAVCLECWLVKQGWQRATTNLLNILLSLLATVAVVGCMTELFKRLCGRLRPDFLARCQPLQTNTGAIPFGTFPNVTCQNLDGSVLKDGHMSFPSGHSSCSMAISLFSALYLLWSVHWRDGGALHAALLAPCDTLKGRLCKDMSSFAALLVVLFDIAWPWGVAVSRFRDNRHNVSDVVGGIVLAACFVPIFTVRLVGRMSLWACDKDLAEIPQQQLAELGLTSVGVLPAVVPDADTAAGSVEMV